jgi:hypothetical protein
VYCLNAARSNRTEEGKDSSVEGEELKLSYMYLCHPHDRLDVHRHQIHRLVVTLKMKVKVKADEQ